MMKRREFITLLGGRGGVAFGGARAAGRARSAYWCALACRRE